MRTYFVILASALLLAALVTQLSASLFPQNDPALLLLVFAALAINGWFNARLAPRGKTARARNRPRRRPAPQQTAGKREDGAVKWFNRTKGYGFIVRESGEEIFVHQRHVQFGDDNRRPTLRDGQRVSFQVAKRDKGLQAERVVPLEDGA